MRNAMANVGAKQRQMVARRDPHRVRAGDGESCARKGVPGDEGPKRRFPKLADLMDGAEDDVFAHMRPQGALNQNHSANPLGRLGGEIKRRTDVVTIFPNEAAIVHLVGALRSNGATRWAVQRRHMSRETLEALSDGSKTKTRRIAAT
jgi:putative transposase